MAEESPYPIPNEFRHAFNAAISAYLVWCRGQPEPEVSLDQKPILISTLCEFAMTFREPMPEELWYVLTSAPGSSGEVTDRSYGSAARYLADLIREREKRFAGLDKQEQEGPA